MNSVTCHRSTPYLTGDLDHHPQLCPLLIFREQIAFLGRSEAALRAEAELFDRNVLCRLVDAPFDQIARLEFAALRCHQPKHHELPAARQEAERFETTRALRIVFQKIAVVIDAAEQTLGDRLVTALRNPRRPKIAAAYVPCDHHVGRLFSDRVVDDARVARSEIVGTVAALERLGALLLRTEKRPRGVVEL